MVRPQEALIAIVGGVVIVSLPPLSPVLGGMVASVGLLMLIMIIFYGARLDSLGLTVDLAYRRAEVIANRIDYLIISRLVPGALRLPGLVTFNNTDKVVLATLVTGVVLPGAVELLPWV